jgi:hypothetical protein
MDKKQAEAVRIALQAAVEAAAGAAGAKISRVRLTYNLDGTFSFRVEGGMLKADGSAINKEAADWTAMARLYTLNPDDLGKTFTSGGKTFKIEGLKTRSHKRPVLASDVRTGKKFVFDVESIHRAFGVRVTKVGMDGQPFVVTKVGMDGQVIP